MKLHRLSDLQVRKAKAGQLSDGGGLYLNVKQSGARSWVFIYRSAGRRREMGLGGYPDTSLQAARAAAAAHRATRIRGEDPLGNKKPAAAPVTFKVLAEEVIKAKAPGWTGATTKQSWERSLLVHAKDLANRKVSDITTDDVLEVLKVWWQSHPESARKLRERIETVLDVGRVRGLRTGDNPARWKGHLAVLLPPSEKLNRGHHRALPYVQAPNFMSALQSANGMGARALEFIVLTGVREGEARSARWGEISEDGTLWSIPASRMKTRTEHKVPLSTAARAALAKVNRTGDPNVRPPSDQYIFPGAKPGKTLSNPAVSKPLAVVGVEGVATVHGFRSTFRDWAADKTDHAREVIEEALSHTVGSQTEQAYRRGVALEKRAKLMQDWADYLIPTLPDQ